ncbi:MAG TPA: amidohydrolase family protein [Candidatus Brocadiia bacterium]|nr:amidohydrolase family protein [Candidatus Brocadiia bacterium]
MPTIWEKAKAGFHYRGDFLVIDAHCHLECAPGAAAGPFSLPRLIETMDALGIERACVNLAHFPNAPEANDRLNSYVRREPMRIFAIALVNPFTPNANLDEARRCLDELGMRGVKVANHWNRSALLPLKTEDAERMEPVFALAERQRRPVICHGFITPDAVRRHPDLPFIIAHGTEDWEAAEAYRPFPNAFFDTATGFFPRATIEHFVNRFGADRIVFGSNMPRNDPRVPLGAALTSGISRLDKEKILGRNMAGLLGFNPSK